MVDAVPPVTGPRLEMLQALGFGDLEHESHVPFLSHLIGTRRVLVEWGSSPSLCDAGLFHSVYGTEYFVPDERADRAEVRAVIGDDAERIAWLWCHIARQTLDPSSGTAQLHESAERIELSPAEVGDVATLWAADAVEQIGRVPPEERDFTRGLRHVVSHASASARRAVAAIDHLLPAEA